MKSVATKYLVAVLLSSSAVLSVGAESTDSLVSFPRSSQRLMAAEIAKDTKYVYVNGDASGRAPVDSAESLVAQFYADQYRQFYDPHAPYFMFLTKDANLALGIGGRLILRGWGDWNGSQDSYEFFPYDIAVPANPTERKGIGASPSQSAIFLTLLGRNKTLGNYMVYVKGGVKNKNFVLKNAYVRINDWTAGYASSTFSDDDALAPTVDAQGPNGQISKSAMLVRYFHTFKSGWSVAGGVEFPSSDQTQIEGETEKCRDFVPDLVGLAQYQWDGGDSHIRASGIFRMMSYRDLLTARNHNVVGWGAQLSGRWQMVSPLALYYQGIVGRGIGSYCGDLSEGSYDLVPDGDRRGTLKAPLSLGITAGLQYDFSKKVFACLALGECRYFDKRAQGDDYKYGLYGAVNVFWNITSRVQGGAEYIIGKRKDFDGASACADRVDVMLSFSF